MARATSEKYQSKKRDAIRAAAVVFAEKGYHGASTGDIASRLGVKQGSIYYYFKSKEDALSEVCLFGVQDYAARMNEIAKSERPFKEKLIATITSHITKYQENSEALKVHNAERLYLPKRKRSKLKAIGSGYRRDLESIFADAQSKRTIRADLNCRFAAHAVIGMCNSWGEFIARNPNEDVSKIIDDCVDLLLHGFAK